LSDLDVITSQSGAQTVLQPGVINLDASFTPHRTDRAERRITICPVN
jgi:hypothetical protein